MHVDAWLSQSVPSMAARSDSATGEELAAVDLELDLVDLSGISISDLSKLDDSALAFCLRRLFTDPGEPVAGFSSSV